MFNLRHYFGQKQEEEQALGLGSMMHVPETYLKHDKEWQKACKELQKTHPYDQHFKV